MLTTLVAIALAFGPGGLLGFVVPAGRYRWAVWSAAPILSLGLTATAMGWLSAVGLPDGAGAVLVGELVIALAVLAAHWLWSRRTARTTQAAAPGGDRRASASDRTGLRRSRIIDLVAVGIPAVVTVGIGKVMLGGFRYPPGWDGMNHAYLTRSILDAGSSTISAVCRTGPSPSRVSCEFYPLAADVSWAQAAGLTGGHVSAAMAAWSIVIGPLALVGALYVAVRLLGASPLIAGAAALAPAVIGPLWTAELTGRITEGVGPGLSVGAAVLAALAIRGVHRVRLGLLAGLSVTGILLTHTYEVLFAATLALALAYHLRGRFRLRAAAAGVGAIVVGTALTVAPFVGVLLGAKGERAQSVPKYAGDLLGATEFWVTNLQRYALFGYPAPGLAKDALSVITVQIGLVLTVPCLLASPFCFAIARLRWARPWVITWLVWTAIGIWTSYSTSAPAQDLAGLWYGVAERLRTMILPVYGVLAVAGACVIGTALQPLFTRLGARGRAPEGDQTRSPLSAFAGQPIAAGIGALVLVVALVALVVPSRSRVPLRADLARRTPATKAYPATFEWLAVHTNGDQAVAADRNVDMMTWLYADYDVKPLFGIPPLTKASRPNYVDRWRAFEWLTNRPGVPAAGCLVRKYHIAYLVTGRAKVPGWPRDYKASDLAASPNLRLVHQDGGLKVWQVTPAGKACATTT